MTAQLPPDPMTLIVEAMTSLHEMYVSAIAAGFSKQEAMTLIVEIARSKERDARDDQ